MFQDGCKYSFRPKATKLQQKFKETIPVATDLADDVDEIPLLEGQLVGLVGLAVPHTLVVVCVI